MQIPTPVSSSRRITNAPSPRRSIFKCSKALALVSFSVCGEQAGVNVTTLGSPNGATPTLNNVADAIDRMEKNNAKPSVIFAHPRTWNTITKLLDLQDRPMLQPDVMAEALIPMVLCSDAFDLICVSVNESGIASRIQTIRPLVAFVIQKR
jgi:hypothetical protein